MDDVFVTIKYGEHRVRCEGTYIPEEAPTFESPGCPESIEISYWYLLVGNKEVEISEFLTDEKIEELTEVALDAYHSL